MPRIVNRFSELVAIKERRDGRKWTYREISEVTGVNPATLTKFARQRHDAMDLETLAKLCDFLGVPVGDFLVIMPDDPSEDPQAVGMITAQA
jgi:DNA-binding Xre family transcriptional regulator